MHARIIKEVNELITNKQPSRCSGINILFPKWILPVWMECYFFGFFFFVAISALVWKLHNINFGWINVKVWWIAVEHKIIEFKAAIGWTIRESKIPPEHILKLQSKYFSYSRLTVLPLFLLMLPLSLLCMCGFRFFISFPTWWWWLFLEWAHRNRVRNDDACCRLLFLFIFIPSSASHFHFYVIGELSLWNVPHDCKNRCACARADRSPIRFHQTFFTTSSTTYVPWWRCCECGCR